MSAGTRHYGAKWWKFDFHNHTPASDDYGKGPDQARLRGRSPRDWLLDFMTAGIDCVAITDHNSGEWVDLLKEAVIQLDSEQPSGYRPITLFPGVEISVNGGVHILALFNSTENSRKIVSVLSKCGFGGQFGRTDECTSKTCLEVVEIIHQENGIAILAHADQDSGLFIEQGGVTLKQSLRADGLLAMEIVNPAFPLPTVYSELKLNLTSVVGSDSHKPTSAGERYTWVKMESPSLEALRLALHDGEDGVRRFDEAPGDPNQVGTRFYLRSMTVSKGQKIGNGIDFKLELSPWLTTLIGGRGSGKSSVLDLLRIALAKTEGLPPEVKTEFEAFCRVPRAKGELGMLRADTSIRVELVKDGRDIALTWINGGNWTQEELDADGNWVAIGEVGDVANRFPVRIFSQKQLYEMTKQPDVLLKLIDERWDKRAWQLRHRDITDSWLENRRDRRRVELEISSISQTRAELEDVKAKIRIFEEHGNEDVLSKFQTAQSTKMALRSKGIAFEVAQTLLGQMRSELPPIELEGGLRTALGPVSADALQRIIAEYEEITSKLGLLEVELQALNTKWDSTLDSLPWKRDLEVTERKFEELKSQLQQAGGADISDYPRLIEQRGELETKVNRLGEFEATLARLNTTGTRLLEDAEAHERTLREKRREVIASWMQPSAGERIRITLQDMGNRDSAESQLRLLIRKPGEEFSNDIYRSNEDAQATGFLADLILRTTAADRWNKLKSIRKNLCEATATDPKGFDRRFARHLEQLRLNTPEDLDKIALWTPEDWLKLELVKADGTIQDIETGSAGQRTAGLLGLVLSLNDSPLIIDQPEDDLETRLISSLVVSGLRQLKKEQQVIVVSHNPNIPVNGAAEQIVEMLFTAGQIRAGAMGALQRKEIRRAVCEVMEGGKDALDKRYYRIARALS